MKMPADNVNSRNQLSVLLSVCKTENPKFFKLAIDSIWSNQTLKPCEIVLVEDGELTSFLYDVIRIFKSEIGPKLKVISMPQNLGLGAALHEGLSHCTGEFVARMDTDDISFPNRFFEQVKFLTNNPLVDIVGSFATEVDGNGVPGILRTMPIEHDKIYQNLWACPLIHPSVVFRREKIVTLGGYDRLLRRRQDYELWFRSAHHGLRFSNIDEPLLYYRFDRGTHKKQSLSLAWQQAIIGFNGARMLKMSFWKQIACFVPFFRALLPIYLQHKFYVMLKFFDPRKS